jgi:hypothetical protein
MRDAVTNLIKTYDITGRYFDRNALDSLKSYFDTGAARMQQRSLDERVHSCLKNYQS